MSSTQQRPELKAKELFDKYEKFLWYGVKISSDKKYSILRERTKEAAIICVSEILELRMINNMGRGDGDNEGEYWESVREHLKNM